VTPSSPPAYDAALPTLRSHVEDLAAALAIWTTRDDTGPDAPARRAANDAMDAIDAMTRELYGIRSRLTGEIRVSDDAAMARSDELLRACRR
jgi:hypothetical protein